MKRARSHQKDIAANSSDKKSPFMSSRRPTNLKLVNCIRRIIIIIIIIITTTRPV